MSWRVVHFIKENTVEAVPASWVKDINGCFWPPYSGLKLRTVIKNCTPPAHDWDLHQSRLIGELYGRYSFVKMYNFSNYITKILGDLRVARSKAAQAEETSDLASENEGCVRKITKKRRFMFDSDSDSNPITFNTCLQKKSIINEESEESDEDNETINIPILRKITKGNSDIFKNISFMN